VVTSLSLGLGAGAATVGPFPVTVPGFYAFRVALAGSVLQWHACLGRCGDAAPRSAGPFQLSAVDPAIKRAGREWRFALGFMSNRPAVAVVRIQRAGGKEFRQIVLNASRGLNTPRPFLLTPGSYTASLTATDAFGRVRSLSWSVLLGP
jgi:hypothetical protein